MMIDKDWDDVPYVDGDCIRDEAEWNDMIAYIKHSASVDFIIYDDEASSNQAFKFSIDGTDDVIEGRTAGNDLKIIGSEGIHNYFKAGEEFKLFDDAVEVMRVSYAANLTTIEGGAVAGDDLLLRANSSQGYGYIKLHGNSDTQYRAHGGHYFYYDAIQLGIIIRGGDNLGGVLKLQETTTPGATANFGALYFKADNKLYAQDGAGVEHEVAFV